MSERLLESIVEDENGPLRLDRYLAKRFDYLSRSKWQELIEEGRVEVNGRVVSVPSRKVHNGYTVLFRGGFREEPTVRTDYHVLHDDPWLLVVNKPGDLPVHPAGPYFNNTLTRLLKRDFGQEFYPVHRLDRETSGVLILAKETGVQRIMSESWADVTKEYEAIAEGHFPKGETFCEVPIGAAYPEDEKLDGVVRKKRKAFDGAPESAKTLFETLGYYGDFSYIRVRLFTGRLHQIRVHLNYLGYPLVADKIYGKDEGLYLEFIETGMTPSLLERLMLPRMALHCRRMTFSHPVTKEEMSLSAPFPPELEGFLRSRAGR